MLEIFQLRLVNVDNALPGRRQTKVRVKEESVYAPRSLFDHRTSQNMLKIRRDMKLHKYRSMVCSPLQVPGIKPSNVMKPMQESDIVLDWIIHEDQALYQAVSIYQGLPLDLCCPYPGHTVNWDLVSDIVNNTSRIFRSPKQCKSRYEAVIVPREEGKILYDPTPKKQKKQKSACRIPQLAEVKHFSSIRHNFLLRYSAWKWSFSRSVYNVLGKPIKSRFLRNLTYDFSYFCS